MKRWLVVALIIGAILIVFIILRNRKNESKEEVVEVFEEDDVKEKFTDAIGSLTLKVRKKHCEEECKRVHKNSPKGRGDCLYKCKTIV